MAVKKANLTRARPEKKTRYVGVLSARSANRVQLRKKIGSIIRPLSSHAPAAAALELQVAEFSLRITPGNLAAFYELRL